MQKRFIALLLTLVLLLPMTAACTKKTQDEGLSIVCTVFPVYDWVKSILGEEPEGIRLSLLVKNGTDVHSYEPTVSDIVTIQDCDLLIRVGGESEAWLDQVLANNAKKDMTILNLLPLLENRALQDEEHGHEHHGHQGSGAYDEHVWLSLKNAVLLTAHITDALCTALPQCGEAIQENSAKYTAELSALDARYASVIANTPRDTLLFADRFPFRYLTEDYGLSYFAAFSGCSAETEASFETVAFLASKADELKIRCVLILENGNRALAKTVIDNTKDKNAAILEIDSLQSYSATADAPTYLAVMAKNLAVLEQALNE